MAYNGFEYQIRYESDGRVVTFMHPDSVEVVGQENPVPPPALPTIYRHPNADNITFIPELFREPAPLPPRTLILSQFYCVFRDSGLPSRVFFTLAEGQEAFPRAQDWHERRVYSDGAIVEGPVQHG
jgi:hypothetical protein